MIPDFLTSVNLSLPWLEHGFGTRRAVGPGADVASVKQIHSALVLRGDAPGVCGDGDALMTDRKGLAVSIRTADCYPILLADPRTLAVAAIHAGWRGTAARIVKKTLETMAKDFGTNQAQVFAAIGPGIGKCCYEVGPEVASHFGLVGRIHLDLAYENRKQLEEAGVPPQNIETLGVCTFCDAERFFSYRREKEGAGRMISFIRCVES